MATVALVLACLFVGDAASFAEDCITPGVDDPPGCTDPAPPPAPVAPLGTEDDPTVVVLGNEQISFLLLWGGLSAVTSALVTVRVLRS